ncbi:MAG: hypothetical protein HY391_01245 [Deltaproteobacteria bacterium]|nr:hypothetical protein [Deltaproteobacteria bacterium]
MKRILFIFLVTFWSLSAQAEVVARHGEGTLEIIGGVRVLRLRGTPYEMGKQHGALLAEEIRQGPVPYFVGSIDRALERIPLLRKSEILREIAKSAAQNILFKPLQLNLPKYYREGLRGMADGSGLSLDAFLTASVLPDAAMLLADTLYGRSFAATSSFQMMGCTTFVAHGPATTTGEMIIGRNLDYPIVGYWDRYPTIIYYEPNEGMKYLAVGAPGINTAGITGLNEAGLTLTLHNHSGKSTTARGIPIVALTNEVIRQSHDIDEAIAMLRRLKPASNWSINLSHWPSRTAAVVEFSPSGMAVRKMEGNIIAQTNFFHNKNLRTDEIFISQGIEDNIFTRYERVMELLDQQDGSIDPASAAVILGDHVDAMTGMVRGAGRVLAALTNITSVVIAPERKKIYVATGRAPVSNSPYLELPLEWDITSTAEMTPQYLEGNTFRFDEAKFEALQQYIRAYKIIEDNGNLNEAIAHLQEAVRLHPDDGHYWLTLGVIALKEGESLQALSYFQSALQRELALTQQQLTWLYQGRAFDVMGDRRSALAAYQIIPTLGAMDRVLKERLASALRRSFTLEDALDIDFQFEFFDLR